MHLDHLVFAAGPEGLVQTAERLGSLLGVESRDGGFHPTFGTRNRVIALTQGRYLEIVEVLDHPAAEKAPFGQAVRARSEAGGGWLGWAVSVDDIAPFEKRLGREAVNGVRNFPDGRRLTWKQLGVKGLQSDPQLPFFVKWTSEEAVLPKALKGEIELIRVEVAGDQHRLEDWLGGQCPAMFSDVDIEWMAPNGTPGIVAAHFRTPAGKVRI
ncbi:VOC family protein [Mariniluteicoccus flavus]